MKCFCKNRENFKTLFILQPTSPLRTKEDILASFKAYSQDKESDSLISVVEEEREVREIRRGNQLIQFSSRILYRWNVKHA